MRKTRLAEGLKRMVTDSVEIQVLPWQVEQVVSITGSFRFKPNHEAGEGLIADAACALLDKGTTDQSKTDISDALERVGASMSFSMGGNRLRFGARCLARDLEFVLSMLSEQLVAPAMPEAELDLLQRRFQAGLERQRTDTGAAVRNELSRHLYGSSHPERELSFDDLGAKLASMEIDRIRAFHSSRVIFDDLKIAVVGDVGHWTPEEIRSFLIPTSIPGAARVGSFGAETPPNLLMPSPSMTHLEIADRLNLNAVFGYPVDVKTNDSDYLALWTAVFVLGGNFSSRLMSKIRDIKGLTYGINSSLSDMSAEYGGAWKTAVTLSQERLDEGVASIAEMLQQFAEGGITSAELEERKMTMIGSYEVQLATTVGLASRMHLNMLRGRSPENLDTHPKDVANLSLEDVNAAIATHLHPSDHVLVTAGTKLEASAE
ncbi:MAG: pitrilysin family protein [Bacteroidetes bacterium]|nr:pitrilysin family protein [Bacteroidota bacterium]